MPCHVLQLKQPSSLPALFWLRVFTQISSIPSVSWLQQPKIHNLCWVPVPTKDFLWILRDKAIAELTRPFCHYNPGTSEALGLVFFFLAQEHMVGATIARKSKAAHETGHTSAVSFIEYATVHYFHCKRQPEHGEYSSLHKNTTGKVCSAQELQNPTQVMSYILWKERQDLQPSPLNIG